MFKKQLQLKHLFYMIILLIMMISFAFIMHFPIYIGIIACIIYIVLMALSNDYRLLPLLCISKKSFNTVKNVMCMLLLIGAILPIWMASGTLPTLLHYSFMHLSNLNIPLSAFLISSFLSMMLGTFIGTLSILGPLFMSLAIGLTIPLPLVAGALISGSVLGDRLSPVSSNFHLICTSCNALINRTFFDLLKTNGPAFIIASALFYIFGLPYKTTPQSQKNIVYILNLLDTHFSIKLLMILPIFLLLLLIMCKKVKPLTAFIIAYFTSIILYVSAGLDPVNIPMLSFYGFHSPIVAINELINGSGIKSMIAVPFIILCSAYLNDLLNYTKLIDQALTIYSNNISSLKVLYHKTALLSILITIISCNQSLTTIITGQNFQKHFNHFEQNNSLLARTIADSGALIIAIIPWNLNALVASSITGVSTFQYAPYTFYILLTIVITLLLPYSNHVYKKSATDDVLRRELL